jgi:hypothetical protein
MGNEIFIQKKVTSETTPLTIMPNKVKIALLFIGVYLVSELVKFILYKLITNEAIELKSTGFLVFTILFIGFFAYKIKERKNWAKIAVLVLFVMKIISLPWVILGEYLYHPVISLLSAVQLLILIIVLVFLFNKESEPWFNYSKPGLASNIETPPAIEATKTIWFWLIIPLCLLGYALGCNMNTSGNVFAGIIMIFGPFIFGLSFIILSTLLLVGLKNKNQSLILVSKIGLLLISFPVSYTAGVIFCH